MAETINALMRVRFDLYNAKRVQICVSTKNEKSRKIPEKLNFKLEGEMENYFINFTTHKVNNGLLYICCHSDSLPALKVTVHSQ